MKKIKFIGNIGTLIALFIIAYKFFTLDVDISILYSPHAFKIIFITLIIYVITVSIYFLPWINIVKIFETFQGSALHICKIYVRANLLKYIPGNIFQYVGRNALAAEYNLSHANVAMSSVIELCLITIAAFFLSASFSFSDTKEIFFEYKNSILLVILIAILFFSIIFVVSYFKFKKKFSTFVFKNITIIKSKTTWYRLFLSLLFYIGNLLVVSIIFLYLLSICTEINFSFLSVKKIINAYILSWLVGFLTPGAPGGVGIREMVMLMLLKSTEISPAATTLALVLNRAVTIAGDIIGYLLVALSDYIYTKYKKWKESDL